MNWLLYLIFNFILYSFLGWVLEEVYCFFVTKSFKKDGFLKVPLKPMYGFAITILVFCYYYLEIRGVALIILFFVVPTIIEYISGVALKSFFRKEYWNYSGKKFNIQGVICLKFSIYWAILSAFVIYIMQNIINDVYVYLTNIFNIISLIVLIYMLVDLYIIIKNFGDKRMARS